MLDKYHCSVYKRVPTLSMVQFLDQIFKEKLSLLVGLDSKTIF